jgi:hypothetical protein
MKPYLRMSAWDKKAVADVKKTLVALDGEVTNATEIVLAVREMVADYLKKPLSDGRRAELQIAHDLLDAAAYLLADYKN